MRFTYKKLWKKLIDQNLKKSDLQEMTGLSSRSIAKLGRDENVSMDSLLKICMVLNCGLSEIVDMEEDVPQDKTSSSEPSLFPLIEEIAPVSSAGVDVKFIDLFAGIGGIRKGFEIACDKLGLKSSCVFTSEIKPHAVKVLKQNHPDENIYGDITKVDATQLPDFDFLLAGFPCQAFSAAGKRLGFQDTRGTLFFDVERILKEKQPFGFVLENVEGLVNHDREKASDPIGRTLSTILEHLDILGYKVSWRVLNAKMFGVPQERKRIYIVGTKKECPSLENFSHKINPLGTIIEKGLPTENSAFISQLLKHYPIESLYGKSIKDKRGGANNIHSWDFEYKGPVSARQKELLSAILTSRRKKIWAEQFGIDWMDGMPLTADQIRTFFDAENLDEMLDDLVEKGYLVLEHPKKKVSITQDGSDRVAFERIPDNTKPMGYNIVSGKLSFDFTRILSPDEVTPTLVAMDMATVGVIDNGGLRHLTLREGLRLFGYPDSYSLDDFSKTQKGMDWGYDLLGNTVCVPVIESIADRLVQAYAKEGK